MTYSLRPAKANYDEFECHNGFWSWILESGPGLVLGFTSFGGGRCWLEDLKAVGEGVGRPDDNSGFVVPDSHARAMADSIQTTVSAQERAIELYAQAADEAEKEKLDRSFAHTTFGRNADISGQTLISVEVYLKKAKELAAWMRESGGFSIN